MSAATRALVFRPLLAALFAGCAVPDKDVPPWTAYRDLPPGDAAGPELAYTGAGEGEPVLLIHGFGTSRYSWRHVIGPLSRDYRVIAVDLKGFGASPKPRDDRYSVYEQARLIRDFVAERELDNVTLVGHSYGGGVALVSSLYLKAARPGMQKALVLVDSAALPQELPGFIEVLATPMLGPMAVTLVPETWQVRSLLEKVYYDDEAVPGEAVRHYAGLLEDPDARYAAVMTARQIRPGDLERISARYADLDLPVLIVWGRHDEIVPPAAGRRLHGMLPDSELIVLDEVGHAPQEEQPRRFLPPLEAFLKRIYSAPEDAFGQNP